jgi:putative tryptophan/tyrosine transport system substrate-binding protein
MKRREFITLLGGAAAAWPLTARAQQGERMRRVGVLVAAAADDPDYQARIVVLLHGLQQLGWNDGRNVRIDTRWATTNADDIRRHAAELAALAPDVLVAATGTVTWRRCYRRPARCRSCLWSSSTPLAPVSSTV